MVRKIVLTLMMVAPCSAGTIAAGDYTLVYRQLTDNTISEFDPQVSGNNATWWAQTGATSSTRDVFFYNGKSVTNLTEGANFAFLNQEPRISASNAVWWGQPDGTAANQREIFYFDGSNTARITNDTVRDYPPVIQGSTAVWEHGDAGAKEIYRSNGAPLTSNAVVDSQPDVHGARIVWINGSTPSQKVMLYDGSTTIEAGTSTLAMNEPRVSDSLVVWQGYKNTNADSSGAEIYRYDGSNPLAPTNLSNNDLADFDPQVSGNRVVWWGGLLGVYQVYLNDGTTTTQLSQSGTRNRYPMIDGNRVVWQGYDGNDEEIYLWDGDTVIPLTDNNYDDTLPQISGNHIVWQAPAGGSDNEIMSARRVLYGDANFDGIVDGADYTLWADNYLATGASFEQGDFNQNGVVDGADYTLWADNYLETDPPPAAAAAVPESSSLTLAAIAAGCCALASRAQRRLRSARAAR